jgi:hypothetical protein
MTEDYWKKRCELAEAFIDAEEHEERMTAYTKWREFKKNPTPHIFIPPLLTDKDIEDDIWENIPIPLSKIDIDTQSDNYVKYLNAVHWAKWGRDNYNGL